MVTNYTEYLYDQEVARWQKIFLTHNVVGVFTSQLKNVMNVLRSCCAVTVCVSTRNKTTNHHADRSGQSRGKGPNVPEGIWQGR
jgi:hypothetical protein